MAREGNLFRRSALFGLDIDFAEAHVYVSELEWDKAWSAFDTAIKQYGQVGMRLARSRALRDWAEGHLSRGEAEDIDRARQLLGEARAEFEAMGSRGYVQTIDARLAELSSLAN